MTTEYHIFCRYTALQWHDIHTLNREYQSSSSRLRVVEFTTNSVTIWHFYSQNCNSLVGNGKILYEHEIVFSIAQKVPHVCRSNGMFLFQSHYDVGCHVALTSISGVKPQQAYIFKVRLFRDMMSCL
jgi:hypothetical protein